MVCLFVESFFDWQALDVYIRMYNIKPGVQPHNLYMIYQFIIKCITNNILTCSYVLSSRASPWTTFFFRYVCHRPTPSFASVAYERLHSIMFRSIENRVQCVVKSINFLPFFLLCSSAWPGVRES